MNEPIGRLGSLSPARARRTALEIVSMASCWPMTRLWSASSICSSRSDSSWAMRVTGMPVHIATTWAMSSSVTSGVLAACAACQSLRSWSTRGLGADSASRSACGALVVLVVDRRLLLLGDALELLLRGLELGRRGASAQADAAGGLVDEVDGLVGQVAVGDVADGQVGGGLARPRR